MGLVTGSSSKLVTTSAIVGRATVIQPGNRKWTIIIECINGRGHVIFSYVIVEGKVY